MANEPKGKAKKERKRKEIKKTKRREKSCFWMAAKAKRAGGVDCLIFSSFSSSSSFSKV
jgi:hypothetical protein